jgi:hypothetical protein
MRRRAGSVLARRFSALRLGTAGRIRADRDGSARIVELAASHWPASPPSSALSSASSSNSGGCPRSRASSPGTSKSRRSVCCVNLGPPEAPGQGQAPLEAELVEAERGTARQRPGSGRHSEGEVVKLDEP